MSNFAFFEVLEKTDFANIIPATLLYQYYQQKSLFSGF